MSILKGDIKLKKTQVMQDVPEGGGAPTSETIPDGGNNTIMPDISEVDRAGGRFNLRKTVVHVDTNNVDEYLGANILVARPPNDPNVSIAIMSASSLFDVRADAANRVESYLVSGPVWSGFLMNDHYTGQRNIQLFQRVGSAPPNVGRTLVLTYLPGTPNQRQQYVRILNWETETRTFSYGTSGGYVDYQAQVVTCEISDALRFDFPGSEPSRLFSPDPTKTVVRDTTVADAGNYFGTQPLALAAETGDVGVKAVSVYTQLVPNSRTERAELDIRPAAVRNIVLQEAPRRVEVATSPHTDRIKITQENRASTFVRILRPNPTPGTINVSFMALGVWYSMEDNGSGQLTGTGTGTINYNTGSISVTLPALPDVGSMVIFTWGERIGFTNRAGQAGFRAPAYEFQVEDGSLEPGTFRATWTSGGTVRTATDNGSRMLTGDASGKVDYATGTVMLSPTYMLDAGGEFLIEYEVSTKVIETFPGVIPDAAGYALITLAENPEPKTVAVRWVTKRNVSESSGASMSVGSTNKSSTTQSTSASVSAYNANLVSQMVGVDMLTNAPADQKPVNNGGAPSPGSTNKPAPKIVQVGVYLSDGTAAYGVAKPYQAASGAWLYPTYSVTAEVPETWRANDPKLNSLIDLETAATPPGFPPAGSTPPPGAIVPPESRVAPTLVGTPETIISPGGQFTRTYTFANVVNPGQTTGYQDLFLLGQSSRPSDWKIKVRFVGNTALVTVDSEVPVPPGTYNWLFEVYNGYYLGYNISRDKHAAPFISDSYTKT